MRYSVKFILTILTLSVSTIVFGQSLDHVRTVQEINATKFMDQLQRSDTTSISKFFTASWFSKNSKKLTAFYKLFLTDLKSLPANAKRLSSLEFPEGLNLVKFRYFTEVGAILQVEVSYKDGDINSKIVHLSLITTKSLAQERKTNRAAAYDVDF